jgi:hypothetical protein
VRSHHRAARPKAIQATPSATLATTAVRRGLIPKPRSLRWLAAARGPPSRRRGSRPAPPSSRRPPSAGRAWPSRCPAQRRRGTCPRRPSRTSSRWRVRDRPPGVDPRRARRRRRPGGPRRRCGAE